MDNYLHYIQKIGLTEKEARVYVALLRNGQSSASTIAKASGLKRPTTYVIIEELRKRGMVLKTPGARKQMFFAVSPDEAIADVKKKISEVEAILPNLLTMYAKNSSGVRTIHYEGIAGVREALWYKIDRLRDNEIRAFFGSTEDASTELIDLFHEWYSAMAKNKTTIVSVVPDNENLKEFRESDAILGFKPKILPPQLYTSRTSIEITDTFIRIIMFKELQAVIIENATVAKALRQIFEIVRGK